MRHARSAVVTYLSSLSLLLPQGPLFFPLSDCGLCNFFGTWRSVPMKVEMATVTMRCVALEWHPFLGVFPVASKVMDKEGTWRDAEVQMAEDDEGVLSMLADRVVVPYHSCHPNHTDFCNPPPHPRPPLVPPLHCQYPSSCQGLTVSQAVFSGIPKSYSIARGDRRSVVHLLINCCAKGGPRHWLQLIRCTYLWSGV